MTQVDGDGRDSLGGLPSGLVRLVCVELPGHRRGFHMKNELCTQTPKIFLIIVLVLVLVARELPAQEDPEFDEDSVEIEEVFVTGTRIARDVFSSPSPIQTLEVDAGRRIGVSSIAELLQRSPVVNGAQIDSSINTSALTNATEESPPGGVGSSNIGLRGLQPERTLVLMNGRRLGSTGVRGAPSQPDISLIPFAMVERVEVLTEAVSAVYGADAVAGVVNVILRDEFEGFEIMAGSEFPGDSGGDIKQLSVIAGARGDRGSFQFAAEVFDRTRIVTGDRDWAHCLREIEQIDDGRIESVCRARPDALMFDRSFETFFFTAGQTDIGVPDWSSFNALPPPAHPLIQDPGNVVRFRYVNLYSDQDELRAADLISELERYSMITTGKLLVDWWSNEELYFESLYLNSRVFSKATTEQIFPSMLGQIPQEDANGNIIVDATGEPVLVDNPLNPFPQDITMIATVDSIPQHRDIEREQSRFLLGIRGDLGNSSWTWDAHFSYDRGIGFQAQPILFEPHLSLSVQTTRIDANGNVVCGIVSDFDFGFITPENCVPLDFTNPDLFVGGPTGEGIFTDAEADYLVGNRTNRTVVEQSIVSAYATGDWFDIGGERPVAVALGAEFRVDSIKSQNDIVGVQGLNAAENPLREGSTIGERDIIEAFAEARFPLLDNLEFDTAVRFTDEENFGSELTWRGRLSWTPIDYLTLSGSVGTSYRAPNLREQFLDGQGGGVSGFLDPCGFLGVQGFIQDVGGDMDPEAVNLTNNCALAGAQVVDTDGNGFLDTAFVLAGATIQTEASGSTGLQPETSDSYTATLLFSQPWTNRFDLGVALSYWDISIENTVEEQDPGSILRDCYANIDLPNLSSPSCGLQTRLILPNGFSGQADFIDISFINIGEQTARGIDINTRLNFSLDDIGIEVAWSTASTLQLEQQRQVFSIDDRDDNVGEIGTPEWRVTSTLSLSREDWEFLMQNRFIGGAKQDNIDDFASGIFAPLLSRDVAWVDSIWYTDMSLTYAQDSYSISAGVNNISDRDPPLISRGAAPNRNNAVTSSGYDLIGRTIFVNARLGF